MTAANTSLGIDIGGTSIKLALMSGGRLLAHAHSTTFHRPTTDQIALALAEAVSPLFSEQPPDGLGLCVPGLIEPGTFRVTRSLNHPGLEGLDLRDLLRVAAGVPRDFPLTLVSDAHAAAHDYAASLAPGARRGRVLALSLGTGVGACVLDDASPLVVSGSGPGHLGALDVRGDDPSPPRASDGSVGTLEAYMGLPALRSRYAAQPGDDARLALSALDPRAMPLLALTRALRAAHALYRPQHIVLLGGVGLALAPHLPALHAAVCEGLTSLARAGWSLDVGTTDLHAARGAATLAARAAGPSPRL